MTKTENLDLDPFASNISDEDCKKAYELAFQQLDEAFENLDPEIKAWLEERKEAAKHIDPETAEVNWNYAWTLDPYGVIEDFPEALAQVGREYYARAPACDIWVEFGDLSEDVAQKLWEKHRSKQAFPAGLFDDLFEVAQGRGSYH